MHSKTAILSKKSLDFPGFLIEQTAKRLKKSFGQTLLKLEAGITADQWVVMDFLSRNDGSNQLEIANYLSKDAPTLTRILDLLSEKGFTIRKKDAADRRKFVIFLTPQGKEKHHFLLPHVLQFRENHFDGLTNYEIDQLQEILKKINDQISII